MHSTTLAVDGTLTLAVLGDSTVAGIGDPVGPEAFRGFAPLLARALGGPDEDPGCGHGVGPVTPTPDCPLNNGRPDASAGPVNGSVNKTLATRLGHVRRSVHVRGEPAAQRGFCRMLEDYLDTSRPLHTEEVTGSIPVSPTSANASSRSWEGAFDYRFRQQRGRLVACVSDLPLAWRPSTSLVTSQLAANLVAEDRIRSSRSPDSRVWRHATVVCRTRSGDSPR